MRNISENIEQRFNISEERANKVAESKKMTSEQVDEIIKKSPNVAPFGSNRMKTAEENMFQSFEDVSHPDRNKSTIDNLMATVSFLKTAA